MRVTIPAFDFYHFDVEIDMFPVQVQEPGDWVPIGYDKVITPIHQHPMNMVQHLSH